MIKIANFYVMVGVAYQMPLFFLMIDVSDVSLIIAYITHVN